MSLFGDIIVAGIKGIKFDPKFYEDKKYKVWICALSSATCKPCFDLHGKLYLPENKAAENLKESVLKIIEIFKEAVAEDEKN